MAITRSNTETEKSEEHLGGPGKRLRDARIARNLELEEVAARLHLHLTTVERIEADDYDNLPAPTFVRGYLRGYARLLDMKPESIVSAYNSNEFDPPPLVRDISNTAEVRSTDISFRLMTYLILTVVIVLVAIWWQNLDSGTPQDVAETLTSEQTTVDDDVVEPLLPQPSATEEQQTSPLLASDESLTESESQPTDSMADTQTLESAASETAAETELTEAVGETVEPDPLSAAEDLGSEDTPSIDDAVAMAEPMADTPEQQAEPPADSGDTGNNADVSTTASNATGQGQLKITLAAESWIEIYARDDRKLYYDLARPGEVVDVSGELPLRVLLGNTSNLTVEFNGAPFDIGPYTNAGIARFSLSSSPAGNQQTSSENSQ